MLSKMKSIYAEFFRYLMVGGAAFLIDTAILILFHEVIIPDVPMSLYISNFLGFTAGIIFNYILSVNYVFRSASTENTGKSHYDKMLFLAIGLIGLLINEGVMFAGVEFIHFNYKLVKVAGAAIVLLWNYIARKKLIFNTKNPIEVK